MKTIKLFFVTLLLIVSSCSIDTIDTPLLASVTTEIVNPSEGYPWGGYWINFNENGVTIERIFISNGATGADGKDGINGIDGIDGVDGVSAVATVRTIKPSTDYPFGGYILTIGVGTNVESVFISNGADGRDGLDGLNGKDGENGTSVTIRTEETEGGTILIITTIEGETRIYIRDGQDGSNGVDGVNGINGVDGKDGKDGERGPRGIDGIDGKDGISSTIRTEVTEGGYNIYITVGTETTVIFIANGTDGTNGLDGTNGINGTNGTDGIDGKDGLNGVDGIDGKDGISSTIRTEETEGGYYIYITTGDYTETIFIRDGQNGESGQDGKDGINGIDGINGTNGVSSTIRTEEVDGGYILYITTNNVTTNVFVSNGINGVDGQNGKDGKDGINGTDGINGESVTIRTEDFDGGYYLYIVYADGTEETVTIYDGEDGKDGLNSVFCISSTEDCENGGIEIKMGLDENRNGVLDSNEINHGLTQTLCNGVDGINGLNGKDGRNGTDGTGEGTVTICHKVTHTNNDSSEYEGLDYVTLTLTLSEYVQHVYEYHNGNSTQNDSFGGCDN